jgi:hypothetical protein
LLGSSGHLERFSVSRAGEPCLEAADASFGNGYKITIKAQAASAESASSMLLLRTHLTTALPRAVLLEERNGELEYQVLSVANYLLFLSKILVKH